MRWLAIVGVVAMAGVAIADDGTGTFELAQLIRDTGGTPRAERHRAADELARRTAKDEEARQQASFVVLTDDPKVRAVLIHALIDAAVISRATAAHVPTAKTLSSQLAKLLARTKPLAVPTAKDCAVTGGTARSATIDCIASRCESSCRRVTTELRVTTGKRWSISDVHESSSDGASCGHCRVVR
jgi:hypothetical protein